MGGWQEVGEFGETLVFEDPLTAGGLRPGWTYVREEPNSWRLVSDGGGGLQIDTLEGGIWMESQIPTRNILLRDLPDDAAEGEAQPQASLRPLAIEIAVDLKPEVRGEAMERMPCFIVEPVNPELIVLRHEWRAQENRPDSFSTNRTTTGSS